MTDIAAAKAKELVSSVSQALEGWVWKETYSSWHLSSLFVAEVTVLNTTLFFLAIIFWVLNRQTHLKSTKGTAITHKVGEKLAESDDEESSTEGIIVATDVKEENGDSKHAKRMLNARQTRSYRAMIDYDTEKDDDSDSEAESPIANKIKSRRPSMEQQGLVDVVKKMKLFSYLNQDALKVCLKYVETVDVPMGKALFERNKYDGSLYAVISGRVRCRFHDYVLPDDEPLLDNEDANDSLLSFCSGPGDVVTPLLSILAALVKDQLKKDAKSANLLLAPGVSAVAVAPNTRLIKIPPRCFAAVLERFPADVYRIAQTIVARVQRTAVQTLVKTLGLRAELLSWKETESPIFDGIRLPEWKRLTKTLATHDKEGNGKDTLDNLVKDDAAVVASVQLGCPRKDCEGLALIKEHSEVLVVSPGTTVVEAFTRPDAVYLLLRGEMEVGIPKIKRTPPSDDAGELYSFHRYRKFSPGAVVGSLLCFGNDDSIFTIRCCESEGKEGCTVLKIPKHVFSELLVLYPKAMARCLDMLFITISPVVHLLNWNSEFMHVQAAEAIARRGQPCQSMFIVLSGRLRAKYRRGSSSSPKRFEEYGRGKCVGDVLGLTSSSWPCDVYAIRNSELARIPIRTLVALVRAYPSAGLHFAREIAAKVKTRDTGEVAPFTGTSGGLSLAKAATPSVFPSYGLTLATVAVVSLSSDIDIPSFCTTLVSSLVKIAPTKLMTKKLARDHLGEKVYRQRNAMHDLKMTRLLAEMEENYRLVVYQADLTYTWWTKLCIQQADCILLAVNADRAPDMKRVEQSLAWAYESMDVRIELVVVGDVDNSSEELSDDDEDYDKDEEVNVSDQLNNWSEERRWITGHHLVRVPFRTHKYDFHRMCRRVTGLSVGLVLGGGGARGLAHLGVIRALMEAGVSIDLVGGTSQGAFVGALYAKSPDNFDSLMKLSRAMANKMASTKEKLFDLTLPMTSMFSGRSFNSAIRKFLGTIRIQDLVLNYFCVTTDIQKRELVVHSKGLLWKYVRASMSLTGYLPPVAEKGSLLVDGGYLNVVPADVMREQFGAQTVIAVDVSPEDEREYCDYGMHLSGWWLLWNSWNPFVETVKVPSMGDISDSLRWVSSDQHRKRIVHFTDLHLTPPIQEYGTLEFGKFDEIVEKGYQYAKPIVDDWVKRNPRLVSRQPHDRRAKQCNVF